jgi:hypothetical protein
MIFQSKNPDVRKGGRLDFLDILLMARDEDGRGLTDEVDTFMFAGWLLLRGRIVFSQQMQLRPWNPGDTS